MPGRLKLELTETQRVELEDMRDHLSRPYLRERAAALLKITGVRLSRRVCQWIARVALLCWPERPLSPVSSPIYRLIRCAKITVLIF